jgi:hypothetical protein
MRQTTALLLGTIVLAACDGETLAPSPLATPTRLEVSSTTAPTITCTRSWASAVNGRWTDAARWTPAGVPVSGDAACITRAGTYTVTLDDTTTVGNLQLGGPGAGPTLRVDESTTGAAALKVRDTLSIKIGSRLELVDGAALYGDAFYVRRIVNDGTLVTSGAYTQISFLELTNNGTIRLDAETMLSGPDFAQTGTIEINGAGPSCLCSWMAGTEWSFLGGRVFGTQDLRLWGSVSAMMRWTAGRLDSNTVDPSQAVVKVFHVDEVALDPSVRGLLDVINASDWETTRITGTIGSNTHLRLIEAGGVGFEFSGSVTNLGDIELVTSDTARPADFGGDYLLNAGTVTIAGDGEATLALDSLVNRSTFTIDADATVSAGRLVNRDTVDTRRARRLTIGGTATYEVATSSATTVGLYLTGGRLTGTGTVGAVISTGGSIDPGSPYGTLATGSVVFDSTSKLLLDIGGTSAGSYDVLAITGSVLYGGTLVVKTYTPQAGVCGQVLPVVTHSWIASGNFRNSFGMTLDSVRAWRPRYAGQSMVLAGFDPSKNLSYAPTQGVSVSEGGPGAGIDLCLGLTRPTSPVDVSVTDATSQISPSPRLLSFPVADWDLPKRTVLTAIDDAVAEPPRVASIGFATRSADLAYNAITRGPLLVSVADNDPGVDLAVSIVSAPATVSLNQTFEVRYRVRNNGPAASTGSTLAVTPLSGVAFVNSTFGVTCGAATGLLTCGVGAIASNAQFEFVVVYRAIASGAHGNTVSIDGHEYDPTFTNDSVIWSITIN